MPSLLRLNWAKKPLKRLLALADERREVAGVVGLGRVLDLDHRRPEVAEHHRAVRAGDDARDVQDGHPAQRPLPVRRAVDGVEDVEPVLLDRHASTTHLDVERRAAARTQVLAHPHGGVGPHADAEALEVLGRDCARAARLPRPTRRRHTAGSSRPGDARAGVESAPPMSATSRPSRAARSERRSSVVAASSTLPSSSTCTP